MPVFGIGSANDKTNPHYDPLKNPLTPAQQYEQLRIVVEKEFPEHGPRILDLAFALEDVGHDVKWSQSVADILHEKDMLGKCAMHFRPKVTDNVTSESIQPLQYYKGLFARNGIPVWESSSINPETGELEEMSATEMRDWDLNQLTEDQYNALAAPDYIIALANAARGNNPDRELLDNAGIPVTMLDLSLERLYREADIPTLEIVAQAELQEEITVNTLRDAVSEALAAGKNMRVLQGRYFVDLVKRPRMPGERPATFGTLGYGTSP